LKISLRCHIFLGQKSRFLSIKKKKKIRDENIKKYKDVIEFYWSNNDKRQGIKGANYDKYEYIETKKLFKLSFEYSHNLI